MKIDTLISLLIGFKPEGEIAKIRVQGKEYPIESLCTKVCENVVYITDEKLGEDR